MAPASPELQESFDRLSAQIKAAEKLLKSLPGARHESASVCIDDSLQESSHLELGSGGEVRNHLCLVYYDGYGQSVESFVVDDLPIDRKLEVVEYIPQLIGLAKAAEGKVQEAVEEAAAKLEHAIAEAREMPDNIEGAQYQFDRWIRGLRGNPARNGSTDPIQREKVTVQPDEAIARFIKLYPRWSKYADELRERTTSPFRLLKDAWDAVIALVGRE